jgi:hypothetical protein
MLVFTLSVCPKHSCKTELLRGFFHRLPFKNEPSRLRLQGEMSLDARKLGPARPLLLSFPLLSGSLYFRRASLRR